MRGNGMFRRLLPIILMLAVSRTLADPLTDLPAPLAGRLQPLPPVSVDMLDPDAQDQVRQARQQAVEAIIQGRPETGIADAYGELGALYQVQHVYTAAETCYHNARTLDPDRFRWAYLHAYLAAMNGDTEQAVARFEQARKLRPDYLAVTLRLANAWLDLNELDKAKAAYREIADADGLAAAAQYGLGQIALLQRNYSDAIDHFEQALMLQPQATRIHYTLAQALRAAGRDEDARLHLQQLGDVQPVFKDPLVENLESLQKGSRVHFSQGMKAIKKHDFSAARDAFARGLEREPDNLDARISLARALYLCDDKAGAKQQLEAVLARDPDNALAMFLLGILAEEGGDTARATELYRQVIAHEPAHAGANFYLANRYYRDGLPDKAVPYYAATTSSDPENLAAYLPYAGALLQTGHSGKEVLAVVEAALRHFPQQPILRYLQIQLLACSGSGQACDSGRALTLATELAEQQSIPPHRELLALATAASGDFDKAGSIQQTLVSDAVWMMPMELARLRACLSAYRDGRLPGPEQLFTWQLLQAPQSRAADVFRDYPTPKPY